jgi:hypothetical protein
MRLAASVLLLLLAVGACHKKPAPVEDANSSRGLTVEAYDVEIPKAPLKGGKLETMSARPRVHAAPTDVSSAPAGSDAPG